MKSVVSEDVILTDLWKVPGNKSLSCILGDMESCESEEIVIDGTDAIDSKVQQVIEEDHKKNVSIHKLDYHDYLVNNVHPANTSSEYDTDDLIEDAKNFVEASKTRIVDCDVWKEIDQTRRQKRISRKERNERKTKNNTSGDESIFLPFVPKSLSDLQLGNNVRVISNTDSRISRYATQYSISLAPPYVLLVVFTCLNPI